MDCQAFRQSLDDAIDGQLDGVPLQDHKAHASSCEACRSHWDVAVTLRDALRDLPVPAPSPGFPARVFSAVRAAHPPASAPRWAAFQPGLSYAAAAALALAVGLSVWSDSDLVLSPAAPAESVPLFATVAPQPVRLQFRSPRDLPGVTLDLEFPVGVELAGFPGQRQLRWQVDLQSGANVLDLPIIVRPDAGGNVIASLSIGQSHRQFVVPVSARAPSGAQSPQQTAPVAVLSGHPYTKQGGLTHA